jgi:hypothetical protein
MIPEDFAWLPFIDGKALYFAGRIVAQIGAH